MGEWQPAAAALADSLVASGAIRDPSWRAVFAETPRHVFAPSFWDTDADGTPGDLVDGSDSRPHGAWLAAVYSDRSLATECATVTVGDASVRAVSAAVPAPSMAAVMLDRLEPHPDHRVLEVGTGTGYVTGLLAARVGADQVTSIDADPQQLGEAADHLYATAHRPSLAIADPLDGWPPGAPYDRIIVTGSIGRVPTAWIEQLAAGGRIVIPLDAGHALAVLVHTPGPELIGRIDSPSTSSHYARPIDPQPRSRLVPGRRPPRHLTTRSGIRPGCRRACSLTPTSGSGCRCTCPARGSSTSGPARTMTR